MTTSLELAHRYRWFTLLATLLITAGGLWLVAADVLIQTTFGIHLFGEVYSLTGFWPMVEHTLRGVLGINPVSLGANVLVLGLAISIYVATQYVFLGAGDGWRKRLAGPAQLPAKSVASAALIFALLTVAIVAMAGETTGFWYAPVLTGAAQAAAPSNPAMVTYESLPGVRGLKFSNHFWLNLAVLAVAWPMWFGLCRVYLARIERRWQEADRFWATGGLTYWLFVASGVILLMSGLLQSMTVGFDGAFWQSGTYTAMAVAAGCLLWTGGPISALLFVSQKHLRAKAGECLACGYDLRGSSGACPECGRPAEGRLPSQPAGGTC